jgi:hypothetical protein
MSEKWDYESRFYTTTRTDDGAYDQILAVSQGLINENFKKLYKKYSKELSEVNYSNSKIGTLSGKVQAPEILIPGADQQIVNLSQVTMKMRYVRNLFTSVCLCLHALLNATSIALTLVSCSTAGTRC